MGSVIYIAAHFFYAFFYMIIDIILLILFIMAILKGYSKGFIVAIFSFLAFFIGLAAAIKLSVVVSGWLLQHTNLQKTWLPFLSFIIVMVGVFILIRWIASLVQASAETLFLGWLNRLAGIVLYVLIYLFIFSVALFYLVQMGILKPETTASSRFYTYIEPLGPVAINAFGKVIPIFKDMFIGLEHFFETAAHKA